MSVLGCRLNLTELSCITAIKLYKSIVLPRCLYGSELWHKLSKQDLTKLEEAHRFCLKKIQCFPKRTKTIIVECMSDCHSIEAYIDQRKLTFFGRLCRLNHATLAKTVFLQRLYQHNARGFEGAGIVHDLMRVMLKYNMGQYLDNFATSAEFPGKKQWKAIVGQALLSTEFNKRIMSFETPELSRFSETFNLQCRFHPVWIAEHKAKCHRKHFRDLAKLNCVVVIKNAVKQCSYCEEFYDDQMNHFIHKCIKYKDTRELYWTLVVNTCRVAISAHSYNLPDDEQTCVILGKRPDIDLSCQEAFDLLQIAARTWQLLAYDKELRFY